MLNSDVPQSVDSVKPFDQGSERTGQLPVAGFKRLLPLLVDDSGNVDVSLAFSFDEEKRRVIVGQLSATLNVECQRCLESMELSVSSNFQVGVVDSEAMADQLPAELEPVVVQDRELDVYGLIEDELIMSLPEFPLHDTEQCHASEILERINTSADAEFERGRKERENPFQVLAGLGTPGSDGQDPDQ